MPRIWRFHVYFTGGNTNFRSWQDGYGLSYHCELPGARQDPRIVAPGLVIPVQPGYLRFWIMNFFSWGWDWETATRTSLCLHVLFRKLHTHDHFLLFDQFMSCLNQILHCLLSMKQANSRKWAAAYMCRTWPNCSWLVFCTAQSWKERFLMEKSYLGWYEREKRFILWSSNQFWPNFLSPSIFIHPLQPHTLKTDRSCEVLWILSTKRVYSSAIHRL